MKKTTGYAYDAIANVLTVTADFAKKASQLNSPEYRIVKQFRDECPGITVQRKTSNASHSHAGIKYSDMENYLSHCRTAERYLFVFGKVRELSKGQPNPYKYVREWFDALCPNYSAQPIIDEDGFVVENSEEIQKRLALPAPRQAVLEMPLAG